jgi:MscS family membrane protein
MLACAGFFSAHVFAEEPPQTVEDTLGRDTPKGTAVGFFTMAEEGDFETAALYLDMRGLPKPVRAYSDAELAEGLYIVLRRALWVDLEQLSERPGGRSGDGLPDYRDELGQVELGAGKRLTLLLQRVPGEQGSRIWKVSNRTMARMIDLYAHYRYPPYVEKLAEVMPDGTFLGVELFKWVAGLITALVAWPILWGVSWLLAKGIARRSTQNFQRLWRFFSRPVTALFVIASVDFTIAGLGLGPTAQAISDTRTVTVILACWVLLAAINMTRDAFADRLYRSQRDTTVAVMRPAATALKSLIVTIVFVLWLQNAGFDVTTLLAGLGIGGLAVALVLQKPLEDVFGAFTLFNQRPIRIGDFCEVGQYKGRIEEISLRTTRIRTLGGTVVSIPNSKLAMEPINNVSIRQRILYNPTLRLSNATTATQLRTIVSDINDMLHADERIDKERLRVRFQQFSERSFDVEVFCDIQTTDFPEFAAIREELNLAIVDIVKQSGAEFGTEIFEQQ